MSFRDEMCNLEKENEKNYKEIIEKIRENIEIRYLPNIYPTKRAKYVFISSEPSWGNGRNPVRVNNLLSIKNVIFHFAIREYFLGGKNKDKYLLTDVNKAAIRNQFAEIMRKNIRNNIDGIGDKIINMFIAELKKGTVKDRKLIFVKKEAYDMLKNYDQFKRFIGNEKVPKIYHFSFSGNINRDRGNFNRILKKLMILSKSKGLENFKAECRIEKKMKEFCNKLLKEYIPNKNVSMQFDPSTKKLNESQWKLLYYYSLIMPILKNLPIFTQAEKSKELYTHIFGYRVKKAGKI